MATTLKNLSDYDIKAVPDGKGFRIGIIVAEWNYKITGNLLNSCVATLKKHKVAEENIVVKHVPGTFELTYAASLMMDNETYDAIIVLGCVIQGETRHFDFICQGVTQGITTLNNRSEIPVIFGVLTTESLEQAQDRAGGKHGNKGDEAAITALKMIDLSMDLIADQLIDMEPYEMEK